jgi:hypothetical protein
MIKAAAIFLLLEEGSSGDLEVSRAEGIFISL